jgi:hypothetical protein
MAGAVSTVVQGLDRAGWLVRDSAGRGKRLLRLHLGLKFGRFVFGSFFSPHVFSTTWPGSFLGSFPVRFFHRYVFSTTSPLRFPVCFRFVFDADPLLSITSPVRFQKKYSFLFFPPKIGAKKSYFLRPNDGCHRLPKRLACLF